MIEENDISGNFTSDSIEISHLKLNQNHHVYLTSLQESHLNGERKFKN